MKRRICSYFDHRKLIKLYVGCTPALLLPAKIARNVDSEENQGEALDTSIITLGHSYITLGQLREPQKEGALLD